MSPYKNPQIMFLWLGASTAESMAGKRREKETETETRKGRSVGLGQGQNDKTVNRKLRKLISVYVSDLIFVIA